MIGGDGRVMASVLVKFVVIGDIAEYDPLRADLGQASSHKRVLALVLRPMMRACA